MSNQKHLFFDLDRTLWDFDTNSKDTLAELYSKYRLDSAIDSFESFYKVYKNVNAELWKKYGKGKLTKEELRDTRFKLTLQKFDFFNDDITFQLAQDYVFHSPRKTKLFPNAIETLEELKNKDIQLHIITNGFKEVQYVKLENANIKAYFDVIICSEEIGVNKPNKQIFLEAIKKAETSPQNSYMIGDDLEVDVLGANAVGMEAFLFDPEKKHKSQAFKIIHSLEQLVPLF